MVIYFTIFKRVLKEHGYILYYKEHGEPEKKIKIVHNLITWK